MASSRKPASGKALARCARIAVGLSGGVDSVVLLHRLREEGLRPGAIHVHHGLSPNADAWARFCTRLCKRWGVPLTVHRVAVKKRGQGLEAAAREARYAAFRKSKSGCIALAHNLDDQAETVLMNLLRGAGPRGARGMAPQGRIDGKVLLRPLLDTPRAAIVDYARRHGLEWIEDESNADESLTRNFIRRRVAPLLQRKFPGWKAALARAARHIARREAGREELLRDFLRSKGLKAPSEAKLVEMLKQLASDGARTAMAHDGTVVRVYRGRVFLDSSKRLPFERISWKGQAALAIPALGGELRFRKARGKGIAAGHLPLEVRLRSGGERLQPDPRRPHRTLKNLFQEAGVPPWQRDRLPLLFRGDELVWVPGLGVDARYQAASRHVGWLPEWRPNPLFLRKSAAGRVKIAG